MIGELCPRKDALLVSVPFAPSTPEYDVKAQTLRRLVVCASAPLSSGNLCVGCTEDKMKLDFTLDSMDSPDPVADTTVLSEDVKDAIK